MYKKIPKWPALYDSVIMTEVGFSHIVLYKVACKCYQPSYWFGGENAGG
jgi:hypothetical protein